MPIFKCATIAVLLGACAAQPPSVYWKNSRVSSGEAVALAGSFGPAPTVGVCDSPACASPAPITPLEASDGSVIFDYPPQCANGPGCVFRVCNAGACTLVADPNAPELWFALAYPPLPGTTFQPGPVSPDGLGSVLVNAAAAAAGGAAGPSVLRVFGRGLAYAAAGGGGGTGSGGPLQCVPASGRAAAPGTVLRLSPGGPAIVASNATCYEASFDLTGLQLDAASYPNATLETQVGAVALPILVASPPPAQPLTVIDVDADAGGNVTVALALANATAGYKVVALGGRTYQLVEPLVVPNGTVVAGATDGSSILSFSLPYAGGAVSVVTGNSDWGLEGFTILLNTAPAMSPAVHMLPGGTNFTARRMNVTMTQVNVSNAFRWVRTYAGGLVQP